MSARQQSRLVPIKPVRIAVPSCPLVLTPPPPLKLSPPPPEPVVDAAVEAPEDLPESAMVCCSWEEAVRQALLRQVEKTGSTFIQRSALFEQELPLICQQTQTHASYTDRILSSTLLMLQRKGVIRAARGQKTVELVIGDD